MKDLRSQPSISTRSQRRARRGDCFAIVGRNSTVPSSATTGRQLRSSPSILRQAQDEVLLSSLTLSLAKGEGRSARRHLAPRRSSLVERVGSELLTNLIHRVLCRRTLAGAVVDKIQWIAVRGRRNVADADAEQPIGRAVGFLAQGITRDAKDL